MQVARMIDAAHNDRTVRTPSTPPRGGADSEEIEGVHDDNESYDESGEDKEHGPAKKKSPSRLAHMDGTRFMGPDLVV